MQKKDNVIDLLSQKLQKYKKKIRELKEELYNLKKISKDSVIDLLNSNSRRKRIGFTDIEILSLVNKGNRAIQYEIANLLKWNKIEAILLTIDDQDKNSLILYRLLEK